MTTETLIERIEKALKDTETVLEQTKHSLEQLKGVQMSSYAYDLTSDFNELSLTVLEGLHDSARLLEGLS